MNITVVGTGYVGLVTGACLADVGNQVLCIDTDRNKIDNLNRGIIPIYEPGLESLVKSNSADGHLKFSTEIKQGVEHGLVILIAVGTPSEADGAADLQYVVQVAAAIGEHIRDYRVIVTKSTVPVGTTNLVQQKIQAALQQRGAEVEFSVVSNPEFLKEGAALEDFIKPDRIIIGAEDKRALDVMHELYAPFNRNHERIIVMDVASAELTKYVANAMLATKISFMNEMANLAEYLGADIESVRVGIGADPRIGYEFIYPGCGYGGSCFPKDVRALQRTAETAGYDARLLSAVEAVNQAQKLKPVEKLIHHFGPDLSGKTFALWGLAFKPGTDDMRAAPSRVVMEALWAKHARVQAFDPVATEAAHRIYGDRPDLSLFMEDPYAALHGAHGLLIVTEWRILRALDAEKIKASMHGDVVVDARNIFSPQSMRAAGLTYYGIGRA